MISEFNFSVMSINDVYDFSELSSTGISKREYQFENIETENYSNHLNLYTRSLS